jgi:RND family efflux transporter MFP subunit
LAVDWNESEDHVKLIATLFATALLSVLIWMAASDYWSADAKDGAKPASTNQPVADSQVTQRSGTDASPGPMAALNPSNGSPITSEGAKAAEPMSATAVSRASADSQISERSAKDATPGPMAALKPSSGSPISSESARAAQPMSATTGGRVGVAEDARPSSSRWDRSMDATPAQTGIKPAVAHALGCLIEPDQVAEVGSSVVGVVESIRVERGDRVVKGQVLAHLRAEVERASVGVASARAEAEADLRAAETNLEFLRSKQVRAEELVRQNFISQQALEQARAEARLAEEKLAQAREQQSISQRELEFAQAQLRMRAIRAPFDGVIADRYVSVGERVEEKPMFRVAKVDPLRVEMVVPAAMFGSVSVNALAYVTPDLRNAQTMPAQVVLVDSLVDGASNTFRVRAHLANQGGALPSGLRCRAELKEALVPASYEPAVRGADRPLRKIKFGLKVDSTLSANFGDDGVTRVAKP